MGNKLTGSLINQTTSKEKNKMKKQITDQAGNKFQLERCYQAQQIKEDRQYFIYLLSNGKYERCLGLVNSIGEFKAWHKKNGGKYETLGKTLVCTNYKTIPVNTEYENMLLNWRDRVFNRKSTINYFKGL